MFMEWMNESSGKKRDRVSLYEVRKYWSGKVAFELWEWLVEFYQVEKVKYENLDSDGSGVFVALLFTSWVV